MIETLKFLGRVGIALVQRPALIPTAVRQGGSLAPQKWWASGSRLPYPRPDYMEFRSVTLSGNADELPEPHDVIVYLEWCRSMRSLPQRS